MNKERIKWTDVHIDYLRSNVNKLTQDGLLAGLNLLGLHVAKESLVKKLHSLKLKRPRDYFEPKHIAYIKKNYPVVQSAEKIRIALFTKFDIVCSVTRVHIVLRKLGITVPSKGRRPVPKPAKHLPFEKNTSIDVIAYYAAIRYKQKRKRTDFKNTTLDDILYDVCQALDVDREKVLGERQLRDLVYARYIFIFIAKKLKPGISLRTLAAFVGYKDHSSSIRAMELMKDGVRDNDPVTLEYWFKYNQNTTIYKKAFV